MKNIIQKRFMKYLAKIKEMLYNKFKKKFERKNVMLEWYDDALQKFNERSLAKNMKQIPPLF